MTRITKKIKLLFILLIGCFYMQAQENVVKFVEDKFIHSQTNIPFEKIFVHTDKDFYLAGEILWFKLYYADGNMNKPLDLSKVAYLDIVDKDQKSVLQSKVGLNEGSGNGSLYLPVTLNSGVYKLRAYTNWMKNFGAGFYFEKNLTIVNSLKTLDAPEPPSRNYDIQFFPEGGNLVEGLQSKVAFRVVDQSGKGIDFNAVLVANNDDTITRFQPLKFGIGHFNFTPVAGNSYKVIINFIDTVVTRTLPQAYPKGYVMNVTNTSASQLKVSVSTNIQTYNTVYLFVHTRQMIKIEEQAPVINGKAEFIIDKNKLGEGISHLTIFNSEKQPVCERLYFMRPTQKLNIQSAVENQEYSPREKIDISVNTVDESGKPVAADMSVSVFKTDSPGQINDDNISSYFWLTSDLKGKIESPGYYLSAKGDEADEAIDNLMLTHGWRRFTWQNIFQPAQQVFNFLPEWRGHIITAKITDTRTGLPAANKLVYLSVPGPRVQLYGSESDTEGNIRFYTKDFYGPNEIVLQTDSRTDTTYHIDISNPFSNEFSGKLFPSFELPGKIKEPLMDESIGVQVQNSFTGEKLKQFYAPEIDSNAFFVKPDNQYMLDDYTRFSTMEEVLREYVFEVAVRRSKENFRLIMGDGDHKIFMNDPFTLFNGVPVFETNKIMQYDPLKVKKIELIKRKYFYGPMTFNGIVNFITYHPEPSMVSDSHSMVQDYEGLQYHREFYSPVYETQEQVSSRLPDFRNVLYWSPDVKTDTQGKTKISFYSSDRKGKYLVVLQGMNTEGKIGEQTLSFEVK